MDQVKEILKQAIKYRFWIALGISLLVPAIAYVVGSGPVIAAAEAQKKAIGDAKKDVEQYANGVAYNREYKPLIDTKTAELGKDVRTAWQKLYDRQAPLLTWPERVQERFTTWGRKWPETEDASRVQFAIIDYVQSYSKFVTEVYNSFRPFDYVEGTGVVAAPPENTLLHPAPFDENTPPDLGKVWAAQERLWIQRALLEVVAEVNKSAKTWDSATIKQIKTLEVGSPTAQDQVSIVSAETLTPAEPITDPKAPPPPPPSSGGENTIPGMGSMSPQADKTDTVYYLTAAAGATAPFKVMPVEMAVLIEQDRVPDFLTALENSPMSIQVKEFSLSKPTTPVVKPEKGQSQNSYGGYGNGLINRGMGGSPMMTFGGSLIQRSNAPGSAGSQRGGAAQGGVDKRSVDRRKKNQDEDKDEGEGKAKRQSRHDPYFNIVEFTFYGQVRFYNPPPPEPAAEPGTESPGEKTAEGETKAADEASKAAEKKDEAAKDGDAPADKDSAAMPKDDDAAGKDEAEKKDEAAKDKAPEGKTEEEPAKDKDNAAMPKDDDAPKKDAGAPEAKP